MNFTSQCLTVAGIWLILAAPTLVLADTVTLEPAKDNTLYETETGNLSNGAGTSLFVGSTANSLIRRALLAFDVAGQIPAGATINGVTLTLTLTREATTSPHSLALHRVMSDWGEGTSNAGGNEGSGVVATSGDATWLHTFFPNDFWTTPGGDFASSPSATTSVGSLGTYSWSSGQMATDVQNWLDDPQGNFGWILIGTENATRTAKRFASRENPATASRPMLEIDFTAPNGGGTLSLSASTNLGSYTTGETLELDLTVNNPGQDKVVDIYVVILLPDGSTLINFVDLQGSFETGTIAALQNLTPLAASFSLAQPFDVALAPFFTHTWTGAEPAGNYSVFFVLAENNALTDGTIDNGDLFMLANVSFTFAP